MACNESWSTKVGVKLLSDLVILSRLFFDIPLDFHGSIWVVLVKYLMCFIAGINTKKCWNIPEEKYFASLKILNLFIKSLANPFVNIALTFFDS